MSMSKCTSPLGALATAGSIDAALLRDVSSATAPLSKITQQYGNKVGRVKMKKKKAKANATRL